LNVTKSVTTICQTVHLAYHQSYIAQGRKINKKPQLEENKKKKSAGVSIGKKVNKHSPIIEIEKSCLC